MLIPGYACREAVMTAAVKTAVNGIGACSPEDSDVIVNLNACASEQTIWLAFINQIKVAFCYIFGNLTDAAANITDLQDDVVELQTEVAALQPTHTGVPTLSPGSSISFDGTVELVDGSTDSEGMVKVTCGSSPTASGGDLFIINFSEDYTDVLFPFVSVQTGPAGGLIPAFGIPDNPPTSQITIYGYSPAASLGNGSVFYVSYRFGTPA